MGRKLEFDVDRALHRAMKLFWAKGYDATSMQELVDALDINRFSIYNSFGDKKALFIKALEHYRQTVLASLLAPLRSDLNPKQRLDAYIRHLGRQILSDKGNLGCMIQNTSIGSNALDNDVQACLSLLFKDLESAIREAVEDAVVVGEISCGESPQALAGFIVVHLQGLIILRKSGQSTELLEEQIQMLCSTVASW